MNYHEKRIEDKIEVRFKYSFFVYLTLKKAIKEQKFPYDYH